MYFPATLEGFVQKINPWLSRETIRSLHGDASKTCIARDTKALYTTFATHPPLYKH